MSPKIEVIGDGNIKVGQRAAIGAGVQVFFSRPGTVTIGDYCTLGPGVKFICDGGSIALGDWTTLHDRCLVLSTEGLAVGQHGWFGQHSVLDGTGGLSIGNGVRVGMYSQIWSHVAAGEQIEGCTLFGTRPVCIEDDVWLVGSCIVASGVVIGRRSIALIGSNITRSWPANSVLAGSPAVLKERLSFYRVISPDEQWTMLTQWLADIANTLDLKAIDIPNALAYRWANPALTEAIAFVRTEADVHRIQSLCPTATVCSLDDKRYTKRLTDIEHRVLKLLAGNKARFTSSAS
jgi:acetyltransferase-like isoleucine patch superfamily enzyme